MIGKKAKDVPLEKALDYVAGYTVANELSARDLGRRDQLPDLTPFKWDWVGQKCFDDACPIGPWIVPASDIKDPQKLGIKLWVNDVIKQDSNTSDMIFNLAEQLSHLSSRITLYPGDIILTGTPAGVGAARRIPQGRRHHPRLGRERRRARQQDGVTLNRPAPLPSIRRRRYTTGGVLHLGGHMRRLLLTFAIVIVALSGQVFAQAWPTRTIKIIVPLTAGSASDVMARIVFDQVSQQVGQPIVIENRPGDGNSIGMNAVAKAEPDGYTHPGQLLLAHGEPGGSRHHAARHRR